MRWGSAADGAKRTRDCAGRRLRGLTPLQAQPNPFQRFFSGLFIPPGPPEAEVRAKRNGEEALSASPAVAWRTRRLSQRRAWRLTQRLRSQDEAPSFVRLSVEACTKLRLHEQGDLNALVELHAKEKAVLHEQVGALSELVAARLGANALAEVTEPTRGAAASASTSDAGLYCALVLNMQKQSRSAHDEAAQAVATAQHAVGEAVARAEAAERRAREVEERCADPLSALNRLADAEAREQLAQSDARFCRAKLDEERTQREHLQLLLDGDARTLRLLPLPQLEALLAQLSRARDAATAALVDSRVAERRAAETEQVEAEARRKAEAETAEAQECPICCLNRLDTALDCGHRACGTCAAKLSTCHVCRGQVKARIRLY